MAPAVRANRAGSALAVLLCCCPRPAPAAPPRKVRVVNLPELIGLARQRSPLVGVAAAGLAVREYERREALYSWFPTGSISYVITGAPAIECRGPSNDANPATRTRDCVSTVNPATGESIKTTNFDVKGVGMQGSLSLLQPLYTFGKIEHGAAAAGHGIAPAKAQVETARADADVEAARAYWGLKAARAAYESLGAARDEVVPWVEKIEKDLATRKPQYTISDLQRLKTALDEVDVLRGTLHQGIAVALAALRALVGEAVDIDDVELDVVEAATPSLEEYAASAQKNRPELRALGEGAAALRSLARLRHFQAIADCNVALAKLRRAAGQSAADR